MLSYPAIRLSRPVLDTLGEIINIDHPDLMVGKEEIALQCATTATHATKVFGCRFYANYVKLHSLYSSKAFMGAKSDTEV